MRFPTIILASTALFASGCDRLTDDEAFGSTFDKCLIKNSIRSGSNGDRALAQTICERHFVRDASPLEAQMGDSNIMVDWPPQPKISMVSGGITVNFRNTNQSVLVKRVSITIDFHKSPRQPDGKWAASDPANTLTWDFPANLQPDENGTFSGSFADGILPGLYYEGRVTAGRVVPYN